MCRDDHTLDRINFVSPHIRVVSFSGSADVAVYITVDTLVADRRSLLAPLDPVKCPRALEEALC